MRVPRPLRRLWEWWKPIAHAIGAFQAKVILTVLYFALVGPFAPIFRAKDPLGLKRRTGWQKFQSRATDLVTAKRQ